MSDLRKKLLGLVDQIEDIIEGMEEEVVAPPARRRSELRLSEFAKTIPANRYGGYLGDANLSIFSEVGDMLVEIKNLQFEDSGSSLSLVKAGSGEVILPGAARSFRVTSNRAHWFFIKGSAGQGGCDLTLYPDILHKGDTVSLNDIEFCF